VVDFGGSHDEANDLLVLPDGKLLLGGWGYYGEDGRWVLLRLTASGQRDTTFDGDGLKILSNQAGHQEELYDLALTQDGRIIGVGTSESSAGGDMLAVLIDVNGVYQSGFGTGGRVVTDLGGDIERLYAVVVDPAGTIYASGGDRKVGGVGDFDWDFAVLSYTPAGQPNPRVNGGAPVTTHVAGNYDIAASLAMPSPNRLLVGGEVGDNFAANLGVLAYDISRYPTVSRVFVGSTTWAGSDGNAATTTFKEYLQAQGLGSVDYGYAIPGGAGQTLALPWGNIDQVSIQFSQDVSVQKSDLTVHGSLVPNYAFATTAAGFAYDAATRTATWTLAQPLGRDRLLLNLDADVTNGVRNAAGDYLDGEWTNGNDSFPSGNGSGGGDFLFRLNVLPGDVNGNGSVLADDFSDVKNRFFRSSSNPGSGAGGYSALADVDGNGTILANDFSYVKTRFFQSLPAGQPTSSSLLTEQSLFSAAPVPAELDHRHLRYRPQPQR
jgi:uncharacterized delta-60 repeat protein